MKALVLGSGAIKGEWEAGAIQLVMENGFQPDIVIGVSVGAINSAFLVSQYENDWEKAATTLVNFWQENICSPKDVIKKTNS